MFLVTIMQRRPGQYTRMVAALILLSASFGAQAATRVRMEASTPGAASYVLQVSLQRVWQKHLPITVNLTANMGSSRSALNAARDHVDFYLSSPSVSAYMRTGTHTFAAMENAPELYENLRQIFNFPLGVAQILVHADSGITSLKDIKGKRVFIGPPGGAATDRAITFIGAATGYRPGIDYRMARLDWGSGIQAFQDDQVAMMITPDQIPSPGIEQVVLLQEVRMLEIPDAAFDTPAMREMMNTPGITRETVDPSVYGGSLSDAQPLETLGSWVGLGTSKFVDEDLVYQITKTTFDHLEDVQSAAPFLTIVNLENALKQMRVPLHPGALRYFREKGMDIPDDLIPPEAR